MPNRATQHVIVGLRVIELLLLFGIAGTPLTIWLGRGKRGLAGNERLLLAPLSGFAALTLVGSVAFALGQPVNSAVVPFWAAVVVCWVVLAFQRPRAKKPPVDKAEIDPWTTLGRRLLLRVRQVVRRAPDGSVAGLPAGADVSILVLATGLWTVAGGCVVAAVYLWPFLQDGQLVFWHYAGSDGYMYMRISEYVGAVGTGTIPTVTVYDAASGFLGEEIRQFQAGLLADKPGTMADLATSARMLGLLTHETYSPLVISAQLLTYLSLLVFGRANHMPSWIAVLFAVFGTLSQVGWYVGANTFLGNALVLPFLPALLVVESRLNLRTAIFGGLLLAADIELFPDGALVALGVLGLYAVWLAWTAWRDSELRWLGASLGLGLVVAGLWVVPFGQTMPRMVLARLNAVLAGGSNSLSQESVQLPTLQVWHALGTVNFIWPAFNLNTLPPEPLHDDQVPFAILLAALVLVYGLAAIKNRRVGALWVACGAMLLILVAGVFGGIFQSDYELFRAIELLSFAPLGVTLLITLEVSLLFRRTVWRIVGAGCSVILVTTLLNAFLQNDMHQFRIAFEDHAADAQYTVADIEARNAVRDAVGKRTVVLASETPTFTAFANVVMLFSSTHIAPTNSFYKFVFFTERGLFNHSRAGGPLLPLDRQYGSDLVIKNRHYADISRQPGAQLVYESADFDVFVNDLIPFFDNDTFPIENGFPATFLVSRQLELARTLAKPTDVAFFNRRQRAVDIEMQVHPDSGPSSLQVSLDGGLPELVPLQADGTARWRLADLNAGLHKVKVEAQSSPVQMLEWTIGAED